MDDVLFLKMLADEARFAILKLLLNGEKCACELPKLIGKSQSNTSMHLAKLLEHGIVSSRRDGKMVLYSVKDKRVYDVFELVDRKWKRN